MEIRAVKDKEPELKLKKQAEVMVHKSEPVAAEKIRRSFFRKNLPPMFSESKTGMNW